MNICKGLSWQDDWLVTIWDSKILLGCNRVTRHCWFWAAIQILRFTEHSSYGHWLKEKTRENQNGKMNLFLFSPGLRNITTFYLNKCFVITFSPESPLSLLFTGRQYRSNLHCSRRSEPWCSNWQRKACLVRLPWHSKWSSAYQLHCTGIQSQWKHSCLRLSCFWFVICNFHPITYNFGNESMIKNLIFSASMAKLLIKQDEIS